MKMINKYWKNRKKVDWLNDNFQSKSDGNWGRYWYIEKNYPEHNERVAYLPEETQGPNGLEVDYDKIKKIKKRRVQK